MKKLDWYILKKLLVTFFFCMILFTVIAVAVDVSEKTDDFVSSGLTSMQIIKQYYVGFVPFIWGLLFPLFVFIAVIYITSRMAARSEIVAILASGTSYDRFLRPYIVGGIFLALILWVGNAYLIPKANIVKDNFQAKYIDKVNSGGQRYGGCYNCFYLRIDPTTYIGMKTFDQNTKTASTFFLEKVKKDKVVYNLRANSVRWDTAVKKWRLYNVITREVDSAGETVRSFPDTTMDLSLKPEELQKDDYLKEKLTTAELRTYINREEKRGTEGLSALKVEKYRRTATSATVLLLTIIGVVIASRKTRGGSGLHLALGIIIAALFIVSDRFSTVFATKSNLPPLIAAWLPNIAFSLVAYFAYRKTPK